MTNIRMSLILNRDQGSAPGGTVLGEIVGSLVPPAESNIVLRLADDEIREYIVKGSDEYTFVQDDDSVVLHSLSLYVVETMDSRTRNAREGRTRA